MSVSARPIVLPGINTSSKSLSAILVGCQLSNSWEDSGRAALSRCCATRYDHLLGSSARNDAKTQGCMSVRCKTLNFSTSVDVQEKVEMRLNIIYGHTFHYHLIEEGHFSKTGNMVFQDLDRKHLGHRGV